MLVTSSARIIWSGAKNALDSSSSGSRHDTRSRYSQNVDPPCIHRNTTLPRAPHRCNGQGKRHIPVCLAFKIHLKSTGHGCNNVPPPTFHKLPVLGGGGLRTVGVGQRLRKRIFLGKPKYQAQCLKRSLLKARSLTQELEMALLRSEGLISARSYAKPCLHDVQL